MTPHPQAHILRAIADGHTEFEYRYITKWKNCSVSFMVSNLFANENVVRPHYEFRIKPATIRIGDVEVNAPLRVAPDKDSPYWVLDIDMDKSYWVDDDIDNERFKRGLCFATEADAIAARDAIVKMLGGEV